MNKNVLITIKKELRGMLRDKKSLMMMLLTPIMIPLFIFIFSYLYNSLATETDTVVYSLGVNYELTDVEKEIVESLNLETKYFSDKNELDNSYENNEISAYILKNDKVYTIYFNNSDGNSSTVSNLAATYLSEYNTFIGSNYLESINVDLDSVYNNIKVELEELKGSSDLVNMIISLGIIFTMMSISLTAIYGVTDSTAGEKERGTLETFLTFPIKSNELVTGKYLAVTISCLITSVIGLILAIGSIAISSNIFEIYNTATLNINFVTVLLTFIIMISYSIFISGLCIAIASFSKTYKEAQSALTPVSFITMVPMFFDLFGVKLSSFISLIPVVSHIMLVNEILTIGLNSSNLIYIVLMFISSIILTFILIKIITKMYRSEKVLFSI